jgi:hypothetical protein
VEKADACNIPQQHFRPQLVLVQEQQNLHGEQVPSQQPITDCSQASMSVSQYIHRM